MIPLYLRRALRTMLINYISNGQGTSTANINNKFFLSIDLSKNELYIPSMLFNSNIPVESLNTYFIHLSHPINIETRDSNIPTSISLSQLMKLFSYTYDNYFRKVKIDNEIYYHWGFTVLDKNFNFLLLPIIKYNPNTQELNNCIWINSSVIGSKTLLEKAINKYILPFSNKSFCRENDLDLLYYKIIPNYIYRECDNEHCPSLIISDKCPVILTSPIAPRVNLDALTVLKENKDKIFNV